MKTWQQIMGAVLIAGASSAWAGEIGDPAPELQIAEWVKGSPVSVAADKNGRILVVDYWATYLPTNTETISVVNALQQRYRPQGVVVVGITDEQPERVRGYVRTVGSAMDYTIALDDDRKTQRAYHKAFGFKGAHRTYIIDPKGRMIWDGHPSGGLEQALAQVVEGTYDVGRERKSRELKARIGEYLQKVSQVEPPDFIPMRRMGKRIIADGKEFPFHLNAFAWEILAGKGVIYRDRVLAERAALVANEVTEWSLPALIDTYARALFDTGRTQEATDYQRKAIELADPAEQTRLEKTLKEYQRGGDSR
jgi:hypothetical protein